MFGFTAPRAFGHLLWPSRPQSDTEGSHRWNEIYPLGAANSRLTLTNRKLPHHRTIPPSLLQHQGPYATKIQGPFGADPATPAGIAGRNFSYRPNAFFESCSGRKAFARSRIALRAVPSDSPNVLSRYFSTLSGSTGLFWIIARTPFVVLTAGTCRPQISTKNVSSRFRVRPF